MALEETVVLDIADGLQQIEALETALTNAATTFKVALADALDVLTGVQVTDVDASQITTSIDTAVDAADLALQPEVDASTVTTAIDDAVEAADTEVEIEALTAAITDDINEAVAAADTTLEIDADTSGAEGELQSLTESSEALSGAASGAASELGSMATGAALAGAAARAGAGDTAALGTAAAGLNPVIGTSLTVIAGLAVATNVFVDAALEAQEATRRFHATFGPLADDLEHIDIGGLNESLSDLALRLGADDDALRQAASSIGQVGLSSGKTREEVAKTAEQILVLAANVSATNPALGTADQIIGGLTNGLARGGRFLGQFGIALTSAEINARALADTGKKTAAELTVYEKSAAGAALASERLGTAIADNINKGAETPTIKLRALRQELLETFEGVGGDLIDPFVESLKSGTPILEELAHLLGPVLKFALNSLVGGLKLTADLLGVIAFGIQQLFEAASHLPFVGGKFDEFADSAGEVATNMFEAGKAADDSAGSTDKAGGAADDAAPQFTDLADSVTEAEEALNALIDAEIAYLDSTVGAESANARFRDNLADITEKQQALTEAIRAHGAKSQEAAEAQRDYDDAVRDARDAALSAAEAQLRLADDTAAAEGKTLTAVERQGIFRQALVNLASQASGPTKAAILDLIGKLDEAAKTRTATLDANVSPALGKLSFLQANLEALRARAKAVADIVFTLPGFVPGQGPAIRPPGAMAGGSFSGGDTGTAFEVGERGREVVFIGPNTQATVVPAERSNNLFGNGSNSEAALVAALNRLANQPPTRQGPFVEQLHVHEVTSDPRTTLFRIATELGDEGRR